MPRPIAAPGVTGLPVVLVVLVMLGGRRFGRLLAGEVLVHEAHRRRPLADRGGDPLDRPVAGVSGGEDARNGGLEREGCPIERPPRRMRTVPHDVAPGQDVAVPALNGLG